ncbi:helix-turn-helix transcriptional regulator [Bacillus sp. JCM 19041]|uniref:helix-turn-helix transcriptional regulator n=1 Tax=Bacillus sp. JCM 19041 TaxID=1460637 RepID=UPI0006D1CD06
MKNNVKAVRNERGMTQAQLAERIEVTRQTIGLIEKGEYNPSLQLCVALAKALNKTLNDLFWEVDE